MNGSGTPMSHKSKPLPKSMTISFNSVDAQA
jgi:hypothetical protein